jgi:uncharacterized protein (UPF0333 family)
MYAWLIAKVGRVVAWLIILVVLLLVLGGIYQAVKHYFVGDLAAQVETEKAQTGAAIESGHVAVDTVGNRQAAEQNGAVAVRETQSEINNATDPGGITNAGLNGLHRVRTRPSGNQRR